MVVTGKDVKKSKHATFKSFVEWKLLDDVLGCCRNFIFLIEDAYSVGLDKNVFSSAGVFSSKPSNSDRAHVKKWSIFCGKECIVHMELVFQVGFWRYHNFLSGEELPSAYCI